MPYDHNPDQRPLPDGCALVSGILLAVAVGVMFWLALANAMLPFLKGILHG